MNVIVTAHQKDVYGSNSSKVGVAPDSMKGDSYFFDNVIRLEKRGKERIAVMEKERAEIGKNKFPEEFPWTYENFCKFYGAKVLERAAQAVKMATPAQVQQITKLLEVVKVDDDWQEKCFIKADVDAWREMTEPQIIKCIEYCQKKAAQLEEKA
jgi:hypothetical protein